MPPPSVLWSETDALNQIAAFVRAACPELQAADVYRAQPGASPAKWGVAVVIFPLTTIPEYASPFGAESDSAQRQRWQVQVTAAAAGNWTVTLLGQSAAPFVAGPGDTPATIATGLMAAVDALALPVTTSAVAPPPPGTFQVLGDVAGASLGVSVQAPVGGVVSLTVVDDNIRRAVWNWGVYRVRLIFRDAPSAQAVPTAGPRYLAAMLADRVRMWLQASSLPATNGLAYPYRRDQLQAAPARLSWLRTGDPITASEVENTTWVRVVSYDVEFQTPVGMTHDVPSLDAFGLAAPPVISDP